MSANPITGKEELREEVPSSVGTRTLDLSIGSVTQPNNTVTTGSIAAGAVTEPKVSGSGAGSSANQGITTFPRVAIAYFDFAVDGGAQGQITPTKTVTIPAGSVILGASLHVTTAVTSAGSATVSADLISAADLVAATGKASLTDDAVIAGKVAPDANPLVTVANTAIKITVAAADLTAGTIAIIVLFAPSVEGAS